ncbi:hypothetical protein GCM10009422_18090 [Brevundimonas kwangchunensis]|uniref:Uncharacterized protein n=1 Tax=Brevundimonas kwangchunensis TaxID=322163 RepID=A0ABP3S093_9CAUL
MMSSLFANLENVFVGLFLGPWQVAPWPALIVLTIVTAAVVVHRKWSSQSVFPLGAVVSFVTAIVHAILVVIADGLGPLIGLGFVAALIAFYPVSLGLLLLLSWIGEWRLSRREHG